MRFALLGLIVGELPGVLYGGEPIAVGGGVCAVVGALAGATLPPERGRACAVDSWLGCMLAVALGMTVDLAGVSALSLASLCRTTGDWPGAGVAMVQAHLRWFPVTAAAMLVALGLEHWRDASHRSHDERAPRGLGVMRLPVTALVEFGGMLVLMSLLMDIAATAAWTAHLPWTAGGMIASMLVSMLLFFHLRQWIRHAGRAALRRWSRPQASHRMP